MFQLLNIQRVYNMHEYRRANNRHTAIDRERNTRFMQACKYYNAVPTADRFASTKAALSNASIMSWNGFTRRCGFGDPVSSTSSSS